MKKAIFLLLFVLIGTMAKAQHQQFFKKEYAGGKNSDGSVTNLSISSWKSIVLEQEEKWNCSSSMVRDNYGNIISGYHLGQDKTFPDFIGEAVEISLLPSNAKLTSHWVSADGSRIVSFERYPYVGEKFAAYELNGKYYVIASLYCGNGIIYVYEPIAVQTPPTNKVEEKEGGNDSHDIIDSYNTTNNYGVPQEAQPQVDYNRGNYVDYSYSGGCYQGGNTARLIMHSAGRTARLIAPPTCRPQRPQQRPPVIHNTGGGRPPMTGGHDTGGRPPMTGGHITGGGGGYTGGHSSGGRPPMAGGHR